LFYFYTINVSVKYTNIEIFISWNASVIKNKLIHPRNFGNISSNLTARKQTKGVFKIYIAQPFGKSNFIIVCGFEAE
jgi:hypothetical protein